MTAPLKITMDVSHLTDDRISGVGVYTVELLKALRTYPEVLMSTHYRLSRLKYRSKIRYHARGAGLWRPYGFGMGADVVHGPDFRVPRTSRAKRVVTIHDLAFLQKGMTSPEFSAKKKADLDRELDQHTPDAIIVVSHATKRALLEYRPGLKDITHVVHLGGDHLTSPALSAAKTARSKYFLFVGNLEARKNVEGIVAGFERYAMRPGSEAELVLIGKPGFEGEKILRRIGASPVSDRIRIQGYMSIAQIHAYYRNAIALVYPSWVEGFGIPVVEAMHAGCPVITSQGTSTEEITGGCATLVDPSSTESIAMAMHEAEAMDPEDREIHAALARAQANSFTWTKCAEETLAVYKKVVGTSFFF